MNLREHWGKIYLKTPTCKVDWYTPRSGKPSVKPEAIRAPPHAHSAFGNARSDICLKSTVRKACEVGNEPVSENCLIGW